MNKSKYPKFRISNWVDTSVESMSKEAADILYGVQIKESKDEPWKHVSHNGEACMFETEEAAFECLQRCEEVMRQST